MIQRTLKIQLGFFLIVGIFLLNGCATEHKLLESTCCKNFTPLSELRDAPQHSTAKLKLTEVEKHMGTNGGTDQKFHPLALKRDLYPFKYDGFLIAIEKAKRITVLGKKNTNIPFVDPNKMLTVLGGSSDSEKLIDSVQKRLRDGEVMFVSHILDTTDISGRLDPYNAYAQLLKGSGSEYRMLKDKRHRAGIYEAGWNALEHKLTNAIVNRVTDAINAGTPYSHIIVMSTGWNTDQVESIQAYNHLAHSLGQGAPVNFHPLYITFSWPSTWRNLGEWFSFVRKRNDADEVGLLPANLLVNHVLRDSRLSNIPRVLIGHSFGARILTRALFSRGLILSSITTNGDIDTLIGLQAAFSFARFSPSKVDNSDSYPYRRWSGIDTELVFTTSAHDKGHLSSWAIFSREKDMMLGKGGWDAAKKSNDVNKLVFTAAEFDCDVLSPPFSPLRQGGRIIYVDASRCIKNHNDIYRDVHGKLMRKFIH